MICPMCGGKCHSKDTHKEVDHIRRTRWCLVCGHEFSTIEVDEDYFNKYKEMLCAQVLELVGRR